MARPIEFRRRAGIIAAAACGAGLIIAGGCKPSPEELAARPVHMRRTRECVSEALVYDLTAAVDGLIVARKRLHAPGLRGDRPLSVEEELEIRPGRRAVKMP